MTGAGDWRKAYRLLRHSCDLPHYAVREIFSLQLGGLALHRNLLHTELKAQIQIDFSEINGFAVMLNLDSAEDFARALMRVAWNDETNEPDLPYHVVREISSIVRSWRPAWVEPERRLITEKIRKVLLWEQRLGREAWTERHLLSYLRIRGIAIEV